MKKMKKGKGVAEALEASDASEAATTPSFIPDEILFNILSRLPVKSISRFRCVSKLWGKLFKDPYLIKMHLDHLLLDENNNKKKNCKLMLLENDIMYSSIDYFDPQSSCLDIASIDYQLKDKEAFSNSVRIVGSCNGLLCITSFDRMGEKICLWNPFTKEYKNLSIPFTKLHHYTVNHITCTAYGFGYDCNTKDYKLVRIRTLSTVKDKVILDCEVHVYTLQFDTWKQIPGNYIHEIYPPGVLVNGTLHWAASYGLGTSTSIVSFDFGYERFTEIRLPEILDGLHLPFLYVGDLGCSLCILYRNILNESLEVWQMKKYRVKESWTKLFTIVQSLIERPMYRLIQSFKTGEFLLYIRSHTDFHRSITHALVICNPENETVKALKISGGDWSDVTTADWSDAKTYVQSLVSLNTGTYLVHERVAEPKAIQSEEAYDEKEEKDDMGQEQVAEPKQIETEEAYGEKEEEEEETDDVPSS